MERGEHGRFLKKGEPVTLDQDSSVLPEIGFAQSPIGESDYFPPSLAVQEWIDKYSVAGDEIDLKIFRQGPKGHMDLSFIDSVSPGEFSYELLQQPPFNGGAFRVMICDKNGFKKNLPFVVERIKEIPASAPVSNGNDTAIATLIAAMSAGFQALQQQIARQAPVAPAGMDVKQTIELITALQPLAGHAAPAPRERDPLDMLAKMLEIQKAIAPAGGSDPSGESVMIEAIRAFGTPLAEMIKSSKQVPVGSQPAAVVNAHPQPPDQVQLPMIRDALNDQHSLTMSSKPELETSEMDMKIALIKPTILIMAANNSDPYPYAHMVLDVFSDDEVEKYINSQDWWTQLLELVPEAASHKEWFEGLRSAAMEVLQESKNPDSVG